MKTALCLCLFRISPGCTTAFPCAYAGLNMTGFLQINIAKNYSRAIFLPNVLMYQKREISFPVEYNTARPKSGDWE